MKQQPTMVPLPLLYLAIEYELSFDDFSKAKSLPLPQRIIDLFKESNNPYCTSEIYPEANLLIITINDILIIWQYYSNYALDTNDISLELEKVPNQKVSLSIDVLILGHTL